MMMNQGGGSTDATVSQLDPNLREIGSANQGYSSSYSYPNIAQAPLPSASVSKDTPWAMHRTDNSSTDNNNYSNSSYHADQYLGSISRDVQNGVSASSHAATTSTSVAASGSHDYSAYTPYSTTNNTYGYGSSGYQDNYYGYQQQQNNSSYPQQVGEHQNSGAPYQSLTSFPNSGSYAGPASYPGTYYNTGDYQTTGGYPSSSYSSQGNSWNDGNYASYPPQQYSGYTPADSNGVPSSSNAATAPLSYEQQWADYYSQTGSDVTCAPGTENKPTTSTSTSDYQIPGVSGGYPISNSQPPPPGTTSWRPEPISSSVPTLQVGHVTGDAHAAHDAYWRYGPSEYQNPQASQNPLPYSNPSNLNSVSYDSSQGLQQTAFPQGPNRQIPPTQYVPHSYQSPMQTIPSSDTRRVSTLQIPTNPRIASNLSPSLPKPDKDTSTTNAAAKPAYISVAVPKYNTSEVSSYDAADSTPKSGAFPPSLLSYLERSLARCKDEPQRNASLLIFKEIATKATNDGTILTQNWDMEPLFPLPDMNVMNKESQSSPVVFSLPKYKRSPSRRTKSRWEPISEEKMVEKLASVNHVPVKVNSWEHPKDKEKMVSSGKWESKEAGWDVTKKKEDGWNNAKFPQFRQQAPNKRAQKMPKKPRLGDGPRAAENGDASSDSDKEHGLTAYYSGAIALANSPEEKKKRENRFKRFDRGHRSENKHSRLKVVGAGNLYTRKASALELSRNNDDVASRAVEDIDWDSLTVKGTCQEIEKRYLRLTSAPDPTTVRPEEVLEKALLMVQNSQKNYLYKCDQLKSIRQDLTVQRIHNELTVKVYETHARLALEAGDLPEFNQCQSQLKNLYAEGINGCQMEFSAYNLLCVILHSSNNRDLVSSMARLSVQAKKDEAIKHALAVRSAVTSGNYVLFFRLYKTAPNLSTCLMDLHVEKMRFEAVKCMSRSYRPTVPLSSIAQVLGFTSFSTAADGNEEKDSDGLEECEEWLKAHGACLIVDNTGEMQFDTKASSSTLFMPEPEDAVAHGDTTLAVNDFLTRTS